MTERQTIPLETQITGELDLAQVAAWEDLLQRAGAVGPLLGVQYDLNNAWLRQEDGSEVTASWCNKNCTTEEGNYNCPAAFTNTLGIQPRTLAPASLILDSLDTAAAGADQARTAFFDGPFQRYCELFAIPAEVAAAMERTLRGRQLEVNLFGGNPELHPGVTDIIRSRRAAGNTVHLTTTGGRFLQGKDFLHRIVQNPPDMIALSADDFAGPEHIRQLVGKSLGDLQAEWKKLPRKHGQLIKAYEAIYTAKLAATTEGFPPILFNMVLHSGNIRQAPDSIAALTEAFPDVRINPFPAQSAFAGEEPILRPEDAEPLHDFIDAMIAKQTEALRQGSSTHPSVSRLHYWLMLRSVFDVAGNDNAFAMRLITGDGIWNCYRTSPAGFYLQIGRSRPDVVRTEVDQRPGGYLGCYWENNTVTGDIQQWSDAATPEAVADYALRGKVALGAAALQAGHACRGCAFPRLTSHIVSTEMGMDPRLVPHYLVRRKQALGF